MKAAFHAGSAGLLAQQEAMNYIGNNLANTNTVGYKAQELGFENLLSYETWINTNGTSLTGVGTRTVDLGQDQAQGAFNVTNDPLDFAIAGDGWFAIETENGVEYTRNGMFQVGLVNDVPYLTDFTGCYVLDAQGQRIQIPQDENGILQTDGLSERVGVFSVEYSAAMDPASANRYRVTQQSGQAVAANEDDYDLVQGAIEFSNVNVADEMAKMIVTQRAYQLSARVVTTSDEVEQEINNLR